MYMCILYSCYNSQTFQQSSYPPTHLRYLNPPVIFLALKIVGFLNFPTKRILSREVFIRVFRMGNLGNGHFRFFVATEVLIHNLRHVHFLAGTEAPY